MHSGAFPSKANVGGLNTVLNVSAEIGIGDCNTIPPLQEHSVPKQREGNDDSRQDPKHCTDEFWSSAGAPAAWSRAAVSQCPSSTGPIRGRASLTENLGKLWPAFSI